ncbi:Galactose mutarotase [Aquimarina amphilecti]|uniref:Galactose mutarotase n=1 Tax=Aquimarina amphilecti TaxID=1038014 RepID=A0A1H7SDU6_AQUAM|nr:aldose 1-epimerase family protein [Aquimarina amphilecti]SEL70841.1 Galactose mutarotase [Aquimarina amphilecti]
MIHTIENDHLIVSIDSIGAELTSIKTKKDNKEFLWQGDPTIWASQAPVLFPIIGGLKNGTYTYKKKSYSLPKHGFIRYNKNIVGTKTPPSKASFSLPFSSETLNSYPFKFKFTISFELIKNQIIVSHSIENKDSKTMFFSVGGHPAFNCPINSSETYEDFYIHLDNINNSESNILSDEGLISKDTISVIKDHKIQLTENLFDKDALIFKKIHAKKATLTHKTKGPVLSMDFNDFPDLGIWAKPKASYVCIEPWLGYADIEETTQNIEEKEGIQKLDEGKIHTSNYTITIIDCR